MPRRCLGLSTGSSLLFDVPPVPGDEFVCSQLSATVLGLRARCERLVKQTPPGFCIRAVSIGPAAARRMSACTISGPFRKYLRLPTGFSLIWPHGRGYTSYGTHQYSQPRQPQRPCVSRNRNLRHRGSSHTVKVGCKS